MQSKLNETANLANITRAINGIISELTHLKEMIRDQHDRRAANEPGQ